LSSSPQKMRSNTASRGTMTYTHFIVLRLAAAI
jgi:hypothetical protein